MLDAEDELIGGVLDAEDESIGGVLDTKDEGDGSTFEEESPEELPFVANDSRHSSTIRTLPRCIITQSVLDQSTQST